MPELSTYLLIVLGAIVPLTGHVLHSLNTALSSQIYQGFFRGEQGREQYCFHGKRRCALATEQEAQHRLVANETGHALILEYSGRALRPPCCASLCTGACWTEVISDKHHYRCVLQMAWSSMPYCCPRPHAHLKRFSRSHPCFWHVTLKSFCRMISKM